MNNLFLHKRTWVRTSIHNDEHWSTDSDQPLRHEITYRNPHRRFFFNSCPVTTRDISPIHMSAKNIPSERTWGVGQRAFHLPQVRRVRWGQVSVEAVGGGDQVGTSCQPVEAKAHFLRSHSRACRCPGPNQPLSKTLLTILKTSLHALLLFMADLSNIYMQCS